MVIGLAIFVWWGVEFQVFPLTLVVVLTTVPECHNNNNNNIANATTAAQPNGQITSDKLATLPYV